LKRILVTANQLLENTAYINTDLRAITTI